MKKQEIKKMSKDEILKRINKFKKDLFNFRFQKINSQVSNPAKINETKKKKLIIKKIPGKLKVELIALPIILKIKNLAYM